MYWAAYFIPFKLPRKSKLNEEVLAIAAFPSAFLTFFLPAVIVIK